MSSAGLRLKPSTFADLFDGLTPVAGTRLQQEIGGGRGISNKDNGGAPEEMDQDGQR